MNENWSTEDVMLTSHIEKQRLTGQAVRRLSVSAMPSIDGDIRTCSLKRKVYDTTVLSVSLVSLLMLSVASSMLLARYTWHAIDVLTHFKRK